MAPSLHTFEVLDYRVVDGDTVEVLLDRSWKDKSTKACRLFGIDAPERSGDEKAGGLPVKDVAIAVLKWVVERGLTLYSRSIKKGKYQGRYVGSVFWMANDGETEISLASFMLRHGLAKPYRGRGKTPDFSDDECDAIADVCRDFLEDDGLDRVMEVLAKGE
jgi:endonuclease YncB( thermonuclease family)